MKILKNYWFIGLIIIFSIIVTYPYIRMEDNIYAWDYAGYWKTWEYYSKIFITNPFHTLIEIRHSIGHDDYNCSSILIILLFKLLPFESRFCYIIGLVVAYLIPTVICFSYLIRKVIENKNTWIIILSYTLPLGYIAFWAPTLRGYPDICGLIFIILSIIFCFKNNLSNNINISKAIKLGVLLWAPFLLRRWYAYTIISLYISLPILNAFYFQQRITILKLKNILINFLISGSTSLVFALIFQWPLLKTILTTSYTKIYSAYQFSFHISVERLCNEVSILFVVLVILSSLLVIAVANFKQKLWLLFFWFNLIISFILFTHTQSPGVQHNLPFSLWMLLIFCQGLFIFILKCKNKSVISLTAIITITFMLFCLFQSLFNIININSNFFSPTQMPPLRFENFKHYKELSDDLINLTSHNKKVSIYSSSQILNEDVLNTISNSNLNKSINYAAQVDLRDKFRIQTLMSDYVVITSPIQTHLRVTDQRVISIPASNVLNKLNIGNAYKKLNYEYTLENNVTAWIYEKTRAFTQKELEDFFQELFNAYPEWKTLYSKEIITAYLSSEINLGDLWGEFSIDNNGVIFAHPGENKPTIVKWDITNIKKLKISSINSSCNTNDTIIVSLSTLDRNKNKTVSIFKGKDEIVDVSNFQHTPSFIEIRKNKYSGCDALKIFQLN